MFVIRHKANNSYLKTRKNSYRPMTIEWVQDISQARVYRRKCDARNSIIGLLEGYYRKNRLGPASSDVEIVPITISVEEKSDIILADFQKRFNELCKEAASIRDKFRTLESEIDSIIESFDGASEELGFAAQSLSSAVDLMSQYV